MKPLFVLVFILFLTACAPATILKITKQDGTVVKFKSAKDQVVLGLSADMNQGTLSIDELQSSSSKALMAQTEREQAAAQTLLDLIGR